MWTKNYSYVASEHSAVVVSGQCTMPPFESEICFSYTAIMTKLRGEVLVTCKNLKVKCDHRSKFSNLSNWKEEA